MAARLRTMVLATEPRADVKGGGDQPSSTVRSIHANAVALFLNALSSAGLGYLSWLFAARVMEAEAVGVASAAVSAALLCSHLAVLGLSTSIITFLPTELRDPVSLLNGFFTIVTLASVVVSVVFVLGAAALFDELGVLGSNVALAGSFVGLATAMTVLLLLDGTSVAVRRADSALIRGLFAGAGKLLVLAVAAVVLFLSATAVVFAWFASTLAACVLGYHQLRRHFPRYRYRPRISPSVIKAAVTNGLANHALNLSRLAPSFIIPLVVAEALSPTQNAYWYAAWMMALLIRFIPIVTAQAVFAEITNKGATLASGIRKSSASNVLVSLLPTVALIIFAHPTLSLLGDEYADAGAIPLQILALGIFPQIAMELYVVAKRVTFRLAEPNIVFALSGAGAIAAAAYGAHAGELVGVALGWLIVEAATGALCAVRLAQAVRSDARRPK